MGHFLLLFFLLRAGWSVAHVEVHGLKWTSSDYVLFRMGLTEGVRLSPVAIKEGIEALVESGYFEDVAIYGSLRSDSSLNVYVDVKENPRLREIHLVGNKKIGRKELLDSLGLHKGDPLSANALFDAKRKIRELYARKGYPKVEVNEELSKPDSFGFVDLTFRIKENRKFVIRKIIIEGNRAISAKRLKRQMKNKEKSLFRSGKFDEEKWEKDKEAILSYYANHGYPEARIDSSAVEFRDDGIYLYIRVNEGKRYVFGNISFEGNTVYSTDFLRAKIKLVKEKPDLVDAVVHIYKGEPWDPFAYSVEKIQKAIMQIQQLYGDSGYLYAYAVPIEEVREDSIVDITFRIHEGNRVRVRKIEIVGNTKTRESVIRRELDIFPGDYFSTSKLMKSQRDLMYLNYFSNVSVDFEQTEDTEYVDLVLKVEEKSTGTIGGGVSYSQNEGIFGTLTFNQPNLFGKGQSLTLNIEYGGKVRNFRFAFTEPWLFGRPQSLGFDIHSFTHYFPEYRELEKGVSVFYSKRLWNDFWNVSLSYTLERVKLTDVSANLTDYVRYWGKDRLTSRVDFALTYDSRDRVFNPIRGTRVSYSLEKAGGFLGGEAHYFRHLLEGGTFIPVFTEKVIFHCRTKFGYLASLADFLEVPLYKRFLLGGTGYYGVRGYDERDIGIEKEGVGLIGGRVFNIITFELRFRAAETFYVVGFFDAGVTTETFKNIKPRSYKKGIGLGFSIEIPMLGVLGVYEAYGFDRLGNKWITQFQLGTQF